MSDLNEIVIDKSNNVLYIGEKTAKYLKRNTRHVLGFPDGKARFGDTYMIFNKRGNMLCVKIGVIGNDAIKPIEKEINLYASCSHFLSLTYNGTKVAVEREGENITISFNDCLFCFGENDSEMAILGNPSGIQFFAYNNKELINNMIQQQWFESYVEKRDSYGKIEEIFERELVDALNDSDSIALHSYRGDVFTLEINTIQNKGDEVKICKVYDASGLYTSLKKEEKILENLLNNTQNSVFSGFSFFGSDENIRKIERLLQKGSVTNATILITGESGTGKTFTAREIHKRSRRADKPFVHVNCAAIPYSLLESELFGYEAGAFTGANKTGKNGLIDEAYGGTLFLDEIAELPLQLQGKLLEVMQSKTYYRVGATKKQTADIRIIVATNKNLKDLVKSNFFREDLYYRINGFPIELPPLRERIGNINSIIADVLPAICNNLEVEPVIISQEAIEKIKSYSWPGNIRELENVLERAVILCDKNLILSEDIIFDEIEEINLKHRTLKQLREQCEKDAIIQALLSNYNDKEKAARYLGIGRTQMFEKIKKYNISIGERDDN